MCGIAGIVCNEKRVDQAGLKAMTDVISHRGPDGEGHWISNDGTVGLGHRRLSIIDLSANGHQPMHYKGDRYTITFNGEIYNYLELKEDLLKAGYQFSSDSDTEVLIALYDQKQENCLALLNGMFSFAIWDNEKRSLFCARDRFGEKPFCYYRSESKFIFSSEIKQLWAAGVRKHIRAESLRLFYEQGEVMDDNHKENTFYENVYSLKAGHYLMCSECLDVEIKSYWSLDKVSVDHSIQFEDAVTEFKRLFKRSVELRLRSDVPVGSSLSGGLDSSCIVYTVNKYFLKKGQQQHTFSARIRGYEKDEGEYIDAILDQLKEVSRHEVFLDDAGFESDMEQIIRHQDEPFQSASIFAQFKVMQLAKLNNIKVLLDGQGADELMGGYEPLYKYYLKQLFFNNPTLYKKEQQAFNEKHAAKHGVVDFASGETSVAYAKRMLKRLSGMQQPVVTSYFNSILKEYSGGRQLQQLLRYADRNSMAHSVEVRLPFLDHHFAEFVFSLPDEFKLKLGWPKYILRKAFENEISGKIIWRVNKVGFETPQDRFLRTGYATYKLKLAEEILKDSGISMQQNADQWRLFMIGHYTN